MKIAIDARMYGAKATTGIGVYIKNLIDNLLEIDDKNEYTLLLSKEGFDEFSDPRVKKIKINSTWYSLSEQIELPWVLLKNKFDLVHFPQFNVPILYPKKFIATIHDITPKFFPGPKVKRSFIRRFGYNLAFSAAIKRSAKIITVSNYTKEQITAHFSVTSDKISVTHLGYDSRFKVIEDESTAIQVKQKLNITKEFLLYVGIMRDHKNIPSLVKAFDIVRKERDIQLVLAGVIDPRFPEIQEAIDKSKYHDDIIVTGFVDEDDLPYLYNAAKLFVLPSFIEGFGLVAIESLACGTPVAASNTASLPEVLGEAATYFDPTNISDIAKSISSVLADQGVYNSLKVKGLNQVQKYSWKTCSKETLEIYETS